jgi:hypothetical protein
MAVDQIQSQRKKTSSYAINVDSKAALLAITNKYTTNPLAVAIAKKSKEIQFDPLPLCQMTRRSGRKWEGRLFSQNSCELQHHSRLRRIPNKSRKADLRRLLHQNLESNIHTHTHTLQTPPTLNYSYLQSSTDFSFLCGQTSFSPRS